MSRSNNTEVVNPSQYFFEWMGSTGKIKYFDKSKGEKGEQVFINLPFTFLVLDRLSCIKGFSDSDQSGFWSNEVRDIRKDAFVVRTKKGIVANGLYGTFSPILNMGACYCQSVYIAIKRDKEWIIANFAFHGSAISQWIDLCKGKDIYKFSVTIEKAEPRKKGITNYFVPIFKLDSSITPEIENNALELDKQLQEYLTAYLKRNSTDQQEVQAPAAAAQQYMDNMPPDDYSDINQKQSTGELVDDLPF